MGQKLNALACILIGLATAGWACAAAASSANLPARQLDEKARQLLSDWQARFDEENFQAVVAGPFVIAGNGTAEQIGRYRDGTILAAARALHAQFFKAEPAEPILILLFETEGPYRRLAKKWFNDDNVPHFGFYRHSDHAMLMNVGTGTGTLVHELTHALIAPDFPTVPDWFNEGLASLYEQSTINGDTIRGLPNWRLPALQKAIEMKTLRTLSEMIEDKNFRAEQLVSINYAQARYLMFYLQEKGLLKRYYTEFRDHADKDPTGIESLKKTIGPQSLDDFEKDWRGWVMTLRFES
jgi:hypothetical protein